ncbi:uncharacterized protein LOC132196419 [Neocloeon triangulifer]|uniref:uncharacterized protein LOC132196419 n=1 Tax=Neocloeon triangulifer TaxID=2078957 RepID=UPI00286EFC25|nr:uncharacterized protein LOC132196419 [Neocloeon triangulifer]XP_059475025.1 uncharacterized protein LOC132196419 [Neocloeon triangulifer]
MWQAQYLTLALNRQTLSFKERRNTIAANLYHLRRRARATPGTVLRRVSFESHDGPFNYEYLTARQRDNIVRNPSDGHLYALFILAATNNLTYDGELSAESLAELIRSEQARRGPGPA